MIKIRKHKKTVSLKLTGGTRPKVKTLVISAPALSSPVPEAKYLANLSVLEPARKVEPVSTVSVLQKVY